MIYHPRYLLSSIEQSSKQHWVALTHERRIRLVDTLNASATDVHDLEGHTGDVECMAWSPSIDHLLASGSQDKTIRLWDTDRYTPLKVYIEHSDAVLSVLFSSSDANMILSGSRDQSLHIWHMEQHTRSPDDSLPMRAIDDEDEETKSNSETRQKRQPKPRPNRIEREKRRAAKVATNESVDDCLVSSTNGVMNECKCCLVQISKLISLSLVNSLAYRLLWPSESDRQIISDLSTLPDRAHLIERIKQRGT